MKQTVKEFATLLDIKTQSVYSYAKRGKILIEAGLIDFENPTSKEFLNNRMSDKKQISTETEVVELRTLSQLKAAKLNEDVRFAKTRNLKIEGLLISTDLVGRAVAEVVQRYKASFVQRTDQLIRDYFNEAQIDNKTIIKAISELTDIANEVSKRANEEAKIAIENSLIDTIR